MGKVSRTDRKITYDRRLCRLLDDHTRVLVVSADNVGSNVLHNIRKGLGGGQEYNDEAIYQGALVLNIPTKINKGTVEIVTPVELIKKGDKVGTSAAALLAKLGIRPFSYGLVVQTVYDNGSVFSPEVLDLTEDDLIEKFAFGVSMVTSLTLAIHYPTISAAPHMLVNGYKNVLAIALETWYTSSPSLKVCWLEV